MQSKVKGILLGYTGVGKTSFVLCIRGCYLDDHQSTPGANNTIIEIEKESINPDNYLLDLWDTAGQEQFISIGPQYIRGSDVIFFFAEWDDDDEKLKKNIENFKKYVKMAYETISSKEFQPVFVVNKIDLIKDFETKKDQISETIKDALTNVFKDILQNEEAPIAESFPLFFISCKDNVNITETFEFGFSKGCYFRKNKKNEDTCRPGPSPPGPKGFWQKLC